jgi:ribosomal protein S18 acetylase RimI-like enzyme
MKYNVEEDIQYKIQELTEDNKDFVVKNIFEKADLKNIDAFISDKNCVGYFVYNEADVLGYIYGYVLPRLQESPMLYIHNMAVKKEYRHLGIGTLMMDAMKQHAKQNQLSKMFLITNKSNKRAVGLFKKEKGIIPHKDDMVFVWGKDDF